VIKKNCFYCGVIFNVLPSNGKNRKFCSRPCFWAGKSKGGPPEKPILQRFWAKVSIVNDDTSCWKWTGCTFKRKWNYGQFYVSRERGHELAHRIAYELTHGEIPEGKWVLHKCDNPLCVRPDHLFLGTHIDNMADMRSKNRSAHSNGLFGELHPNSKLTDERVIAIYRLLKEGKHVIEIAQKFDVDRHTVSHVIHGRTWTHVKHS
jgi:hypothetical protein